MAQATVTKRRHTASSDCKLFRGHAGPCIPIPSNPIRPAPHYDYRVQAWIADGKVAEGGHPASMRPGCCYAGEHAGEKHECHEECR